MTTSSSLSKPLISTPVPWWWNDAIAASRSFMPKPAFPSLACVPSDATISSTSSIGHSGKNDGRRSAPLDALQLPSNRPCASSQTRRSSGPASEASGTKIRKVELDAGRDCWPPRRIRDAFGLWLHERSWHLRALTFISAIFHRDADFHVRRLRHGVYRPSSRNLKGATMRLFISFVVGLVFGIGLYVSGMTQPSKVQGFLDIFGHWDPSLAFVMAGAVAVGL